MKGLKPQAIRTIQLKVAETGEIFSEKLKAFTLELVDFKDKPEAYPKSQIEYWLYNLVNMESMTEVLPLQTQQHVFRITPTYTLCTEAILVVPELLLCVIGGGTIGFKYKQLQ